MLERVQRIKTGHQRLLGRVKLVRDVLERLMEDDADMLRMCLSRAQRQLQLLGRSYLASLVVCWVKVLAACVKNKTSFIKLIKIYTGK